MKSFYAIIHKRIGAWTLDDVQKIIDILGGDLAEAIEIRDILKEGGEVNDQGEKID